jgi:hypothetical protein
MIFIDVRRFDLVVMELEEKAFIKYGDTISEKPDGRIMGLE